MEAIQGNMVAHVIRPDTITCNYRKRECFAVTIIFLDSLAFAIIKHTKNLAKRDKNIHEAVRRSARNFWGKPE